MNDVNETILLEEGEVTITNRRVVIGPARYALSDIISVRMTQDRSTISCFVAILLASALLIGLFSFITTQYSREIFLAALLIGGSALIVALLVPPYYILHIRSKSGRVYTIKSVDAEYLSRIVDALYYGRSFETHSVVNPGLNR